MLTYLVLAIDHDGPVQMLSVIPGQHWTTVYDNAARFTLLDAGNLVQRLRDAAAARGVDHQFEIGN